MVTVLAVNFLDLICLLFIFNFLWLYFFFFSLYIIVFIHPILRSNGSSLCLHLFCLYGLMTTIFSLCQTFRLHDAWADPIVNALEETEGLTIQRVFAVAPFASPTFEYLLSNGFECIPPNVVRKSRGMRLGFSSFPCILFLYYDLCSSSAG